MPNTPSKIVAKTPEEDPPEKRPRNMKIPEKDIAVPLSRYTDNTLAVDRAVPALAAVVIAVSIVLVALVSPWWLFLTGFVALNLALYATIGWCPASCLMEKAGMPRTSSCRVQ